MNWTEREIGIAKQLSDKDVFAFMKKIFVDLHTNNGEELKKNVVALDDAEYGRLMKVYYLSQRENSAKLSLIQKIAKEQIKKDGKQKNLAPR